MLHALNRRVSDYLTRERWLKGQYVCIRQVLQQMPRLRYSRGHGVHARPPLKDICQPYDGFGNHHNNNNV